MLSFLEKYKDRVKRSKKVLENCYKNADLKNIPLLFNISPYYFIKSNRIETKKYFSSPLSALETQLKSIEDRLEVIEDDYVPYLNPYYGVCALASGFGGRVTFYDDKDPWLNEYVINDFKDIDKLKKPDPKNAGLLINVFDLMKTWRREVGDRIPLGHTDMQGPISIGIDLMGVENFFIGIIDHPKKMHKLLEVITEYIIDTLKYTYEIIGERDDGYFIAGVYVPVGFGKVRLSEDNIVFISAEFCREFLDPYIERIFSESGNGSVHWCGDGFNNIGQILNIKGIMGLNNCSMGDIDILKKQNEISVKNKIIYHNEAILPKPEWFSKVNEIIKKEYFLNHFIVPSDEFGISFDGYETFSEDKIDCINKIIKINNGG